MPTYELIDGEEQNRQTPVTFQIPPLKERMHVPDGWHVKLGFKVPMAEQDACFAATGARVETERMWVQVDSRESENGVYYGTLENHPAVCRGVKVGDSIQFEAKNILNIVEPD
jgi:hypothetical protein